MSVTLLQAVGILVPWARQREPDLYADPSTFEVIQDLVAWPNDFYNTPDEDLVPADGLSPDEHAGAVAAVRDAYEVVFSHEWPELDQAVAQYENTADHVGV